nr:MAG TPA: hypothetical protein [Caudoviricetes sp.]
MAVSSMRTRTTHPRTRIRITALGSQTEQNTTTIINRSSGIASRADA